MNNINSVWINALENLISVGSIVRPRNMETYELLAYQSVIDMSRPIITVSERKINHKFLFGEALWILSGSNRVSDISKYMNAISKFSDNGITFRGAYGPKVVEQLDYVISNLAADECSRQAVLTIWRENPMSSKDIPCTVALQWFIRDNELHCVATMRSSDIWLGWVYDTFNFSMISAWIAIALRSAGFVDLQLGQLHLTAGSQHIYEKDISAAEKILDPPYPCATISKDIGESSCKPIDLNQYLEPDDLLVDLKAGADKNWSVASPFITQVKP